MTCSPRIPLVTGGATQSIILGPKHEHRHIDDTRSVGKNTYNLVDQI